MIRKMVSINRNSNRRRLIHFNMNRQHLCPLCNNHIYFDNKEEIYKCRNSECNFKENKFIYNEDKSNLTNETEVLKTNNTI